MPTVFAHSVPLASICVWEPLQVHSAAVAALSAANAAPFGAAQVASAAGLLHDLGKCSSAFQAYIHAAGTQPRGPDHSTAGAIEARRLYPGAIGRILAFCIAGHHAGLSDGMALVTRLTKDIPPYGGWEGEIGPLPSGTEVVPHLRVPSPHRGFSLAFLTRMLFSCLVDADFVETEAFYARHEGRQSIRDGFTPLPVLNVRLRQFMAATRAAATPSPLNELRASILDQAIARAALPPGLFTLTVPTGSGKTLASLSFALKHALYNGLRRVIYVIPFTSVIEQVAGVFRQALADAPGSENHDDILEHHATFDWETAARRGQEDGRGSDPADRLRRAAENWAALVIVTTAVQFFESLFANRTSRCRKLHNLAGSVIVLDEAQTLPLHLLRPCLAALDELKRNYGVSIVFCTATQPALRVQDGFDKARSQSYVSSALDIPPERELAPDPIGLYTRLRRVAVERLDEPVPDKSIAARFAAQPQMLCIVNTRAHAQDLFALIRDMPGAVHLSTLMCPAHRRHVLADARQRLKRDEPVRIVSTSLIEAGVDIDLPEVWRAGTGIDSIAQAAGRCNREGRLPGLGRVVVFEPVDGKPPQSLKAAWQAGRSVLKRSSDPLGLDAVRDYFKDLYWQKGADALDHANLEGERFSILDAIAERAAQKGERDPELAFPFASIAQAFQIIDDVTEPVVVPWSSGPEDETCKAVLGRIASMEGPLGPYLRKLQRYVVGIPRKVRAEWLALGLLKPVHPRLGDALLQFDGLEHYDDRMGVRLSAPLERSARSSLM